MIHVRSWGLFDYRICAIKEIFLGSYYRFLVPKGCDLVAVGAFPVAYGTSHVALVHRAKLHAGQVD